MNVNPGTRKVGNTTMKVTVGWVLDALENHFQPEEVAPGFSHDDGSPVTVGEAIAQLRELDRDAVLDNGMTIG